MKYIQAKHPAVCWPLLPWFVENGDTREEIFMQLYGRLEKDPDNTFVLIAMEDGYCHGFMVAYCQEDDVLLWQARTRSPFDKLYPENTDIYKHNNKAFDMLFKWTLKKGKNKVSAICNNERTENLVMRRYGFKKNGNKITKEIP
jgi:hypothetical protein